MTDTPNHPPSSDTLALRRAKEREAQLKQRCLAHRSDMIWNILGLDLGHGQSIVDIALLNFLSGESDAVDIPLHDLSGLPSAPRSRSILMDLWQACLDHANALPILPLGTIEVASRWHMPRSEAKATLRLRFSLGAKPSAGRFWLSLSRENIAPNPSARDQGVSM